MNFFLALCYYWYCTNHLSCANNTIENETIFCTALTLQLMLSTEHDIITISRFSQQNSFSLPYNHVEQNWLATVNSGQKKPTPTMIAFL